MIIFRGSGRILGSEPSPTAALAATELNARLNKLGSRLSSPNLDVPIAERAHETPRMITT